MRLAVTALAAALALLCVAACSSSGGSSSQGGGSSPASTLTVGEFNPFTGPDAAFGPEMVAGCIPAIRLINARQVTARERKLYEEILRKEI